MERRWQVEWHAFVGRATLCGAVRGWTPDASLAGTRAAPRSVAPPGSYPPREQGADSTGKLHAPVANQRVTTPYGASFRRRLRRPVGRGSTEPFATRRINAWGVHPRTAPRSVAPPGESQPKPQLELQVLQDVVVGAAFVGVERVVARGGEPVAGGGFVPASSGHKILGA